MDDFAQLVGYGALVWMLWKCTMLVWRAIRGDSRKPVYEAAPEDREEARRLAKVFSTASPAAPEQIRLCVDCKNFREPLCHPSVPDALSIQMRAQFAKCEAPENMVLNVVTGVPESRSVCATARHKESSDCGPHARWFVLADKAE